MANPNRTVAAARSRKMAVVEQAVFKTRAAAETWAATKRAPGFSVRVSSYKIGPKSKPIRQYMARVYQK